MADHRATRRIVGVTNPERVAAVRRLGVLEYAIRPRFDRLGWLIQSVLGTDYGSIALVDDRYLYYSDGLDDSAPFWNRAMPIDDGLVARQIVDTGEPMQFADALDHPELAWLATGAMRAYIGVPLWDHDGVLLGILGAVSVEPRHWTPDDLRLLEGLAKIALDELESALNERTATESEELLSGVLQLASTHMALLDDDLRIVIVNSAMATAADLTPSDLIGQRYGDLMYAVADQVVDMLQQVLDTGVPYSDVYVIGPPRGRNGPRRVFSTNAYRLMHSGRQHVALIANDVTEVVDMQARARDLATITELLARAESVDETERIVTGKIRQFFRADAIELSLAGRRPVRHDARPDLRARIAASLDDDRTLLVDDTEQLERSYLHPNTGQTEVRIAEVTIPIPCVETEPAVAGAVRVRWHLGIGHHDVNTVELRTIGGLIASALERQQLMKQRAELIAELQNAILIAPTDRDGIQTSVRHTPAVTTTGLGGDWFDVVPIDAATTALVVGDIAGHGAASAAAMSQVGSTIAQLLIMGTELTAVFAEAERVLAARSLTTMATVGIVIVDVAAGTVTSASAGHPPPLLIGPDRRAQLLPSSLRPPLCSFPGTTERVVTAYEPGSRLVMFTDGLIERRGADLGASLDSLVELAPRVAHLGLDDMVDALVDTLTPDTDDDVVVLAAQLSTSSTLDDFGARSSTFDHRSAATEPAPPAVR